MQAVKNVGTLEPEILPWGDGAGDIASLFMLMRRVEGEAVTRWVLRDAIYTNASEVLVKQYGEVLVPMHGIDPMLVPMSSFEALATSLASHCRLYPVLVPGVRWLRANCLGGHRGQVVVHRDFRNGNLVIGPEEIPAVLDREVVHLGDSAEDLSWLCGKTWRFGVLAPGGGFGSYRDLLAGYGALAGQPIDLTTPKC